MADAKLIDWLKDAYFMEMAVEETLKSQLRHAHGNKEAGERIKKHILETRRQAERVKTRALELGGEISGLRNGTAQFVGIMQGLFSSDELADDAALIYAVEQFEMMTYKKIWSRAYRERDQETIELCRKIMEEERQMAAWVDSVMPSLAGADLSRGKERIGAEA